jgi:hypothetical protein
LFSTSKSNKLTVVERVRASEVHEEESVCRASDYSTIDDVRGGRTCVYCGHTHTHTAGHHDAGPRGRVQPFTHGCTHAFHFRTWPAGRTTRCPSREARLRLRLRLSSFPTGTTPRNQLRFRPVSRRHTLVADRSNGRLDRRFLPACMSTPWLLFVAHGGQGCGVVPRARARAWSCGPRFAACAHAPARRPGGWVFSLVSAGSAQPSWWSCWSPTQNSLPCDSMQPGYEMIRGEKVSRVSDTKQYTLHMCNKQHAWRPH